MNNNGTSRDIRAETVPSPRDALILFRLPHGGFMVRDRAAPGDLRNDLFACTTIDEAFAFMRREMAPPQQVHVDDDLAWAKSTKPSNAPPDHQSDASPSAKAVVHIPNTDYAELARKLGLGQHNDGPQ